LNKQNTPNKQTAPSPIIRMPSDGFDDGISGFGVGTSVGFAV
jgi:hypothetical protein